MLMESQKRKYKPSSSVDETVDESIERGLPEEMPENSEPSVKLEI